MFYQCKSLRSLNLSNFEIPLVTHTYNMFDGCENLEYINLQKYNEITLSETSDMFNNVPKNLVICINADNNINLALDKLNAVSCLEKDCSLNWKSKKKKY